MLKSDSTVWGIANLGSRRTNTSGSVGRREKFGIHGHSRQAASNFIISGYEMQYLVQYQNQVIFTLSSGFDALPFIRLKVIMMSYSGAL